MFKKLISLSLAMIMVLAVLTGISPTTVFANQIPVGSFYLTSVYGGWSITEYRGQGNGENVTIPRTHNGMPILSIGNSAFNNANISTVTFESTSNVTNIGNYAFLNANITSITIPSSVTNIGHNAFANTSHLHTVNFEHMDGRDITLSATAFSGNRHSNFRLTRPSGSTGFTGAQWDNLPFESSDVPNNAWEYRMLSGNQIEIIRVPNNLRSNERIVIPSSIGGRTVREIGFEAFHNLPNLQEVEIPTSVTRIDDRAFRSNSNLRRVYLQHTNGNDITVHSRAFEGSHSALTIFHPANATNFSNPWNGFSTQPTGTTDIPNNAWDLELLPNNQAAIRNVPFNYRNNTRIVIPSTMTMAQGVNRTVVAINADAFLNLPNLRYVEVPSTVARIYPNAFRNNSELRRVYLAHTNWNNIDIRSGAFAGNRAGLTIFRPANGTNFPSTLPNHTNISFQTGTAQTGWSLANTTALTGNNVVITSVPDNLRNANRIEIPETIDGRTVRQIEGWAFDSLPNLRYVVIPASVQNIRARAFNNNRELRNVYLLHTNAANIEVHNLSFEGSHSSLTLFYPAGATGFTSPTWRGFRVESVGFEEHWDFSPLGGSGNEVMITRYTGNASIVTIPETLDGRTVRVIGNEVFRNNTTITEIIIPDTVVAVNANAVINLPNLRTVRLRHMYADTIDMSGLAFAPPRHRDFTILFPANATGFTTPTWVGFPAEPDFLSYFWEYTVSGNVTTITRYNGNEEHVEIPAYLGGSPVRIIARQAFRNNTYVERVTIPQNVNEIASHAFHNLPNLYAAQLLHTNANQLPRFSNEAFVGVALHFRLIVPNNATGFSPPAWIGYPVMPESEDLTLTYGNFEYIIRRETPQGAQIGREVVVITRYLGNTQEVTIPSSIDGRTVVALGDFAFTQNVNIRRVTIPASITDFGHFTFLGASNLAEARFMHPNVTGLTLRDTIFRYTADNFTILFPPNAAGFTTPNWQGFPARASNAAPPTNEQPGNQQPGNQQPGNQQPGGLRNPHINTTRTLNANSSHMTRDGEMLAAPIFRLEPFAPNRQFSTSYVMVRVIADILGLEWSFNPATNQATFSGYNAQNQYITMVFTINSSTMLVNGAPRDVRASAGVVPAISRNGRLFVPVLVFQEVYGVTIRWDAATQSVTVNP